MGIIALTMGTYAGTETSAKRIAEKLGLRCADQAMLEEAARRYDIPEARVHQVFEGAPSLWERMTESRRAYLAYIQAAMGTLCQADNLLYHGHAGQELLRLVPHSLRVRLMVPLNQRVRLAMQDLQLPEDEALHRLEHLDAQRSRRTRYLFGADWQDPYRYDMVLHLEHLSLMDAEKIIAETARMPQFQLDDARRWHFDDFLIKSEVGAIVATHFLGRPNLIGVTVQRGEVTLKGTLTSQEAPVEQAIAEVRALPSVRAVHNEITQGMIYSEWNL